MSAVGSIWILSQVCLQYTNFQLDAQIQTIAMPSSNVPVYNGNPVFPSWYHRIHLGNKPMHSSAMCLFLQLNPLEYIPKEIITSRNIWEKACILSTSMGNGIVFEIIIDQICLVFGGTNSTSQGAFTPHAPLRIDSYPSSLTAPTHSACICVEIETMLLGLLTLLDGKAFICSS